MLRRHRIRERPRRNPPRKNRCSQERLAEPRVSEGIVGDPGTIKATCFFSGPWTSGLLVQNRLSYNVGGVKLFSSVLTHAL
jgi:hypothetical protein